MLVLSGIAIIVLGFLLRFNALFVVALAAIVTALCAGLSPLAAVERLGAAVRESRFIAVIWLILPMIGLLERAGLQEQAARLVLRMRRVTAGRVLLAYLLLRQVTSALGLASLGGHVQMVRPLVAPMAEAAAERDAPLTPVWRDRLRAHAAAADNIGFFFGEDIFIAVGSILLMVGFMQSYGITLAPLRLGLYAVPTAIAAFAIHAVRLRLLDRALRRRSA